MSYRVARILAKDIREGDFLRKDGHWLPVAQNPSEEGDKIFVSIVGQKELEELERENAIVVAWDVPSTTYGMRAHG